MDGELPLRKTLGVHQKESEYTCSESISEFPGEIFRDLEENTSKENHQSDRLRSVEWKGFESKKKIQKNLKINK